MASARSRRGGSGERPRAGVDSLALARRSVALDLRVTFGRRPLLGYILVMRSLSVACLIVGFGFAAALRGASVEFAGYAKMTGETEFILTDGETGRSSGWLKQGQTFLGFSIRDFDAGSEILSVSSGQEILKLPLKSSRIDDRDAALARALKDEEARFAAGQVHEERVLLSRLALHSFRRDAAPALADKIRHQEAVVAVEERREQLALERRAVGVATELDVKERTLSRLQAGAMLRTLQRSAAKGG